MPYIVSGSGGFAATPPEQNAPPAGTVVGDHKLEVDPIIQFGYLTLTTDGKTLTVTFKIAPRGVPPTQKDYVTLDLASGTITESTGNPPKPPAPTKAKPKPKKPTKAPKSPVKKKR
jgi:hypothetical protein